MVPLTGTICPVTSTTSCVSLYDSLKTVAMANARPSTNSTSRASTAPSSATSKTRHLSHLHSQLAQLSANLSDLENLLRMTAVQAESMRGLGGWSAGLYVSILLTRSPWISAANMAKHDRFMASSKVLGEEAVAGAGVGTSGAETQPNRGSDQDKT